MGKKWPNQHSKIPILNLCINWEKLGPTLSLTVENKVGNLHKGLFTFQME